MTTKGNNHNADGMQQQQAVICHSLDIPVESAVSSWGSVFAAAASVKLEEVDDVFLQQTRSTATPLAEMAELAATNGEATAEKNSSEKKKKKDKKRSREEKKDKKVKKRMATAEASPDDDAPIDSVVSDSSILEGRMVSHPIRKEEQVMILVDKRNKIVYSAFKQTDGGERFVMGTLLNNDADINWNEDAFDTSTDPNDHDAGIFPFPTDSDDHCESPLDAYQDIVPLLEKMFPNKKDCKIYDPYYCNGAVKANLSTLGFPNVYNEKEDCYLAWETSTVPDFDVLITNPPYSRDHIPKLIDFLSSPAMTNKPWFLLMPQWVSKKDYYCSVWDKRSFYLLPGAKRRYVYVPPKDFREKKASDVHKKSSPFVSMWFAWGGSDSKTSASYQTALKLCNNCELARSKNGLRDLRRKGKRKK